MDTESNSHDDKKNVNSVGTKVIAADWGTILHHIKQSNYGDHNFLMYSCLSQLEDFYTESCKDAIMYRNEIFFLAIYYQDLAFVRRRLYLEGIDVRRHESDDTLVILDSEIAYRYCRKNGVNSYSNNDGGSNNGINTYDLVTMIEQLQRHAEKLDKNGITIFGDLGSFIMNKQITDLLSYESSVPNIFDSNIRAICCYHKDDFETLKREQRQKILSVHANNFFVV
jgi:DcmR-like sensory protein